MVIGDNETWTGLKTFCIPIFEYAAKKIGCAIGLGLKLTKY